MDDLFGPKPKLNLFPPKMFESTNQVSSGMTPESVMSKLIQLEAQAHHNHLNTNSFAAHMAMGQLYEGIGGFKDGIMENILGHIAPKRLGDISIGSIVTTKDNMQIAGELSEFGRSLEEWAEEQGWCDLENTAAEVVALGTKIKYLLTLS